MQLTLGHILLFYSIILRNYLTIWNVQAFAIKVANNASEMNFITEEKMRLSFTG